MNFQVKHYSILFLFFFFASYAQQTIKPAIDFSVAGYKGGAASLPEVNAILTAQPTGSDDTRLLQGAIDYLSKLPLQKNGFRGALLLPAKTFQIKGQLRIKNDGIVLRGSNSGNQTTKLIATGQDRRTLILIGSDTPPVTADSMAVTDKMVPAGSYTLTLENVNAFKRGDRVVITRPSTKEWIRYLGMDTAKGAFADLRIHWRTRSRDLLWDRTIVAVNTANKTITLDAPITTSLEQRFGGGIVTKVINNKSPKNIGIENLILESAYNKANLKDEEHSWIGIQIENAEDVFVSGVAAFHFVASAVRVGHRGRRVTIKNCQNLQPVSEVGGYRRQSFLVEGQQVLVYQCYAENGMNDYASGLCAGGPNVFLACHAKNALDASGSFESWNSGILYENVRVEGAGLHLVFDMAHSQGGGWTAANSLLWNCKATSLLANGHESAPNFVVTSTEPLYEQQLKKRTGHTIAGLLKRSPAVSSLAIRHFTLKDIKSSFEIPTSVPALQLVNGRFVIGKKTMWGGSMNDAWWMGQTSPAAALDAGISITRYVPGRIGPGLTENLPQLVEKMQSQQIPFYQSGPCLWYDRRRDDHTIGAYDRNVWAPFYEMPWARTGKDRAWDGLSKFDLSQFNPWFYSRTKEFAGLAQKKGFVLYHSLYNTHNVLEIGAHWADYPWRPANNINETGLPEPPPLEPNNRLHMANQIYSTEHPEQKRLHKKFMLHVLNELGGFRNVIFNVSFQFAGPLSFQQFFIETVDEWVKKNKKPLLLSLATSKDITDSILANPEMAKHIAVIDMRYWQYRPDGKLFAPPGGKNLAFREMIGKEFRGYNDAPPATTPEQAYRQVKEYRNKFPDKAIVAWHNGVTGIPALMAGAAQVLNLNPTAGHGQGRLVDRTKLDAFVQEYLSASLHQMLPANGFLLNEERNWSLADKEEKNVLLYSLANETLQLKKSLKGKKYKGYWYNPRSGAVTPANISSASAGTTFEKPSHEEWLLYLKRN